MVNPIIMVNKLIFCPACGQLPVYCRCVIIGTGSVKVINNSTGDR